MIACTPRVTDSANIGTRLLIDARSGMLAVKELLGSKLKFGLIALAIGLVVSLTLLMAAMSEGLLTGMTGAKGSLAGDALVFQGDTYPILERSVLSAEDLQRIASAEGVANSYGIGHVIVSVNSTDEPFDARVFGLGDRFDQLPLVEGDLVSGPGQAVIDVTAKVTGVGIGDTLGLTPIDEELDVVGITEDRQYVMTPAVYVDLPTWERLYLVTALGRMQDAEGHGAPEPELLARQVSGSASIAAVELEEGFTLERLASELGSDFVVVTPEEAALAGNGMPEMVVAIGGIQVVSLAIGALIVGVFSYITTLHKTGQIAAIKALGASNGYVYRQLLVQITLLVPVASAFGLAMTLGASLSMPPTMGLEPQPERWAITLVLVYIMAYLGSLFSLRSILAIDPATALDRAEH